MPSRNPDLHGNVPDKAAVALLLIDVINDLEFPEGDQLFRHARPMADRLAAFKRRAKEAGVPVVYVNANFGRWRSGRDLARSRAGRDKSRLSVRRSKRTVVASVRGRHRDDTWPC